LEGVKKIIISGSNIDLKEGFELAHSPEEALGVFEAAGFKEAIIIGGATVNSEFAKRCLIDEVIFYVNPSVLGNGIPVFRPEDFELKLDLIGVEKIADGIVELQYKVKK